MIDARLDDRQRVGLPGLTMGVLVNWIDLVDFFHAIVNEFEGEEGAWLISHRPFDSLTITTSNATINSFNFDRQHHSASAMTPSS
jgi:hypothetical protein